MNMGIKIAAIGASAIAAHGVATLFDNNKGSLTNRSESAKEHLKNDLIFGAQVGAIGIAAKTLNHTKAGKIVATGLGKLMGKTVNGISHLVKKCGSSLGDKLLKNPTKAGALGIATALLLNGMYAFYKFANNKGKIDQKYEDAAKIESTTKNVILEEDKSAANLITNTTTQTV